MKKLLVCILFGFILCIALPCFAQEEQDKDKVLVEVGTLVNKRDYKAALRKCDSALKQYPDESILYYWKATIYRSLGDKELALKNFDKAIELNPENPKTYVMRGIVKSELGNKEAALIDYNKAIELDPKNSSAYSMRAIIKIELSDFDGATKDLEQSNKLINTPEESGKTEEITH